MTASITVLTVLGFDANHAVNILSGDAHFTLQDEDSIFAVGVRDKEPSTLYSIVYRGRVNEKALFHVYEGEEFLDNAIVKIGQPLILTSDDLDD